MIEIHVYYKEDLFCKFVNMRASDVPEIQARFEGDGWRVVKIS